MSTNLAEHFEWCDTHCYHCGRTLESIAAEGPTPNCLCSDGMSPVVARIHALLANTPHAWVLQETIREGTNWEGKPFVQLSAPWGTEQSRDLANLLRSLEAGRVDPRPGTVMVWTPAPVQS